MRALLFVAVLALATAPTVLAQDPPDTTSCRPTCLPTLPGLDEAAAATELDALVTLTSDDDPPNTTTCSPTCLP